MKTPDLDLIKVTLDLWSLPEETIAAAVRAEQTGNTEDVRTELPSDYVSELKEKASACGITPELALGLVLMNGIWSTLGDL